MIYALVVIVIFLVMWVSILHDDKAKALQSKAELREDAEEIIAEARSRNARSVDEQGSWCAGCNEYLPADRPQYPLHKCKEA